MNQNSKRNSETLFRFKETICGYNKDETHDSSGNINPDKIVLYIPELEINKGEITVLLGPSGSGKSTFLEAVGLMNETIIAGQAEYFDHDNNGIDFANIWGINKEDDRYQICLDDFSFIFQTTNFMSNFSAEENVALSQLIKGVEDDKAFTKARQEIKDLRIYDTPDKIPSAYSGGQRQRMAFSRAFAKPDFSVLFGDEPTGNLDVFNSRLLWEKMRNDILCKNTAQSRKSAIIVTHSVELAVDYADHILVLTQRDPYHIISPQFCYDHKKLKWREGNKASRDNLKMEIEILLDTQTTPVAEVVNDLDAIVAKAQKGNELCFTEIKNSDKIQNRKIGITLLNKIEEKSQNSLINKNLSSKEILNIFSPREQDLTNCHNEDEIGKYIDNFRDDLRVEAIEKAELDKSLNQKVDNEKKQIDNGNLLKPPENAIPTFFSKIAFLFDRSSDKEQIKDFLTLFYKREIHELAGKGGRSIKNLWLVFSIFLVLFIALGFSFGTIEFFKNKQNSVFVRYVTSSVSNDGRPIKKSTIVDYLIDLKQDTQTLATYNVRDISFFINQYEDFSLNNGPKREVRFRSIDFDDSLIEEINKEKGAIKKGNFKNEYDYSVIIKEDLLYNKLGLKVGDKHPKFINYHLTGQNILLPIASIVKELPDNYDMLATPMLVLDADLNKIFDNQLYENRLQIYIDKSIENFQEDSSKLETALNEVRNTNNLIIDWEISQFDLTYSPIISLILNFDNLISKQELDSFYNNLSQNEHLISDLNITSENFLKGNFFTNPTRSNQTDILSRRNKSKVSSFVVIFNETSDITSFKEVLSDRAKAEMEMSKVESLQIFGFVKNMATILAIVLIILSCSLILLFMNNILKNHLESIKMNIGTFMAFGIKINNIYFITMLVFLILPMISALILSGIFGYFWGMYAIVDIVSGNVEKDLYFSFTHPLMGVTILLIIIVNSIAFKKTIRKILERSPSDLIYNRSNKA